MAVEWVKTKFLGVRYRFHKTRKHGVGFDRCFCIRYKIQGKDKEEVAGWASEGMTAEKAYRLLSEIRENIRTGAPDTSLASIRRSKEEARAEEERLQELSDNAILTVDEFWTQTYEPHARASKTIATIRNERIIYNKWVAPLLRDIPISSIRPSHIETLAMQAHSHGKSPQTIRHIIALVSQMWNLADTHDIVTEDNPFRNVKKPQQDSRRMRFLTPAEAISLLKILAERSKDTHDAAVLSLFAGLRAGEIHSLTWADIDFPNGTIYIKDPKNKHSRHAFITPEIFAVLKGRVAEDKTGLIFPSTVGTRREAVSDSFERAVKELGLNNNIVDSRQKVVFHILRHTFASWLVQRGTPLYTVAELMGHTSLEMTKRYAHLAPDTMRQAAMELSGILKNRNTL